MKKRFRTLILFLAVLIASAALLLVAAACANDEGNLGADNGHETPCEHDFVPAESDSNRLPTYTSEGRQYVVCSKCGYSRLEIVPPLEYQTGDNAPDFAPVLREYSGISDGTTISEFTEKYLPAGWAFSAEAEDDVLSSGEYTLVFTSASEGYYPYETTVTITIRSEE